MPKILAQGVSIIVQLIAGLVQTVPSLLANWKKILEAVLSVISAINWLNIGKTILTGVANGVKSMGSSLLNAFKGGFSSALAWIKSLPRRRCSGARTLSRALSTASPAKAVRLVQEPSQPPPVPPLLKTASGEDVDWEFGLDGCKRQHFRQCCRHGRHCHPGL